MKKKLDLLIEKKSQIETERAQLQTRLDELEAELAKVSKAITLGEKAQAKIAKEEEAFNSYLQEIDLPVKTVKRKRAARGSSRPEFHEPEQETAFEYE